MLKLSVCCDAADASAPERERSGACGQRSMYQECLAAEVLLGASLSASHLNHVMPFVFLQLLPGHKWCFPAM